MIYTVAIRLPDGTKIQGYPRSSLKAAESLALFRASELPTTAAAIILDHMFRPVAEYPGQVPLVAASNPKPKKSKRRRR